MSLAATPLQPVARPRQAGPRATISPEPSPQVASGKTFWWRERELWLLLLIVSILYLSRITAQPICGEESRWANGATEMLATGDWIVPRQQGSVFPERPPLGSWTMAITALAWGRMDAVAVRLPSVLAVLGTVLLLYGYGRTFMTPLGALGAAAAYASFGQVLQLGQLGESEALFTFLLGGALLVWHWGYAAGWRPATTWSLGYGLAALAALDKGPQAPVYMAAVTCVYLVVRRDWRFLLSWSHAAGLLVFALIVGAWQIPFYFATDAQTVADIWSGLARDRFSLNGLLKHMASYPWETLGCLLPWSPLLAAYLSPRFRGTLGRCRPQLVFLATALCVTYPSVWLSAEARGRYFMPLYPCLALLVGLVIERLAGGLPDSEEGRDWRRFLRGLSITAVAGVAGLAIATFVPLEKLADARQPVPYMVGLLLAALTIAGLLWLHTASAPAHHANGWLPRAASLAQRLRPSAVLLLLVAFFGAAYQGIAINLRLNKVNDMAPALAELRTGLPKGVRLVSFGPVAHRFAYFYGEPIEELSWPEDEDEVPGEIRYFCFDKHKHDNNLRRSNGRGRQWAKTLGTLPFEWEPVGKFPCDPIRRDTADTTVVVGRIIRAGEYQVGEKTTTERK
jgi:4-amino-4-deoxy-L-arabinose transferase-like glycosyltransferase